MHPPATEERTESPTAKDRSVDTFETAAACRCTATHMHGSSPALRRAVLSRLRVLLEQAGWSRLDTRAKAAPLRHHLPLSPATLRNFENRLTALACDPAKGGTSPGSIEEAAVGFAAELGGVMQPPASRDPTGGAEFIDQADVKWDVKSPLTPPAGAHWHLDVPHQLVKVKKELEDDTSVLLNLSGCTAKDADAIVALLAGALTPVEQRRIFVLR